MTNRYAQTRDLWLEQTVAALQADARVVAAWLSGSFGRGDADEFSDLDLTVVVRDERLCVRDQMTGVQPAPERLTFIQQFGTPAILHEAHRNASANGTFTYVMYTSGVIVDWILVPPTNARRPHDSRLLFQKTPFPTEPPPVAESLEERRARIQERYAFFWMMAAVTAKYLRRSDGVAFHHFLTWLADIRDEVRRLLDGRPATYSRDAPARLHTTPEAQLAALQVLCREMDILTNQIRTEMGISGVESGYSPIRTFLDLTT